MTNSILPEILNSGKENSTAISIPDKFNVSYSELKALVSELSLIHISEPTRPY